MKDNESRSTIPYWQGEQIAEGAMECLGSPFRLHGRRLEHGLDCVGVVLHALRAVRDVVPPPDNYRLKGPGEPTILLWAKRAGLLPLGNDENRWPGDIMLVAPSAGQSHLLVMTGRAFVHAHLGCRKTIIGQSAIPWPVRRHWRLCAE